MKIKITVLLIFILIFSGFDRDVFAQENGDDLKDRVEKIKLDKLIKKLDLDSITALTFKEKYKNYSKEIKILNKKRVVLYLDMAQNIESGNGLDTIVNRLLEIEKEIFDKKIKFTEELQQIFSARQIATMIIFERKFASELKKLLKEQKRD
jgi:hypothetical protein